MSKRKKILIASVAGFLAILLSVWTAVSLLKPISIDEYYLHQAGRLARMAETLGDEEMKKAVRKKVSGLRGVHRIDPEEFTDMFQIWEYLALYNALSLPVDEEQLINILRPFYNEEMDLFCVSKTPEAQEYAELLYTSTQLLLEYWPQVLDYEEFSLREGIINSVQDRPFIYETRRDLAATEAGGAVILMLGYLSDHDGVDYRYLLPDDVEEWFEIWKTEHESPDRSDGTVMLARIAHYIWQEDTVPFAQEKYNAMTAADIPTTSSELANLNFLLRYVDVTQNPEFYEALKQRIWEMIDQFDVRRVILSERN